MGKTLIEADLTSKRARKRLPLGLHWRAIEPGVHLGYRRPKVGAGEWLVRWRHCAGYKRVALGTADDEIAEGALEFAAALTAARRAVAAKRREAAAEAAGPVPTVASAVDAYVAMRDARETRRAGRPVRSDAGRRLAKYVTGRNAFGRKKAIAPAPISIIPLHKLTERDLVRWREELPTDIKSTTRQRLFNDLKAALNGAYAVARDFLPPTLPAAIKFGLRSIEDDVEADPVARDNQILSDAQVAKIVAAARTVDAAEGWGGDLYRMILVLAATGARFSQAARMRVGDVQPEQGRLLVPASRKGKGAKKHTIPVPVGQDVLNALAPAVDGRPDDATLLVRWRSVQVPGGGWRPDTRGPWLNSSELQKPWELIKAEAEMPEAIPYALRHSSVVRGIRANLPIRLVAALHDTSTAMIERHYSKYIASGLEELARAALVQLTGDG